MAEGTVLDRDTSAPVVPAGGQGGKDDNVTLTRAEVDALRRDRDEARESEKYWAGIARQGGGGRTQQAEEANDTPDASEFIDDDDEPATGVEGDTPEKMVDDLAAKGVAALSKRGFITRADAIKLATEAAIKVSQTLISRERGKITSDAQLMTEFPELKDQKSELYAATAKIYQEAVRMDPSAGKSPAALYLAAKAAKAALKPAAPARRNDDDDQPEEEDDRQQRARSQDSRPRGRSTVDDDADMLGDEARTVIKGFGITEEEFKAARKETARSRPRGR